MDSLRWSDEEKKIARRAFDMALHKELAKATLKVKEMARDIQEPSDLWEIEDYLTRSRKKIDSLFDYRYSQLPMVFGILVRNGLLGLEDLQGLGEEKMAYIRFMQR